MAWVITVLTVLVVLTGVLMTFLILLQEGKGGGLAALGGTKAAGVEGVTNPVRRATAYMAVIFFILLVALGIMNKPTASFVKFGATTAGAGAKKEETKAPEAPKAETPAAPAPAAPATPAEAPKAEAPKADAPKAEAPKADAPKTDAPKAEEKKPDEAKK